MVAADVFIYLGDLSAAFTGVRRVLDDDGVFAFSVEVADDTVAFELRPSSRYAQSERYLRELAAAHGFEWLALRRGPLRLDQRTADRRPLRLAHTAPRTLTYSAYSEWLAAMKSRLFFAPPKHTLAHRSGSAMCASGRPSRS